MERESFEDKEVARIRNEHFIAVKVGREERPDVDDVYMKAVQMMTGSGGWPLSVFLTPEQKPFYGGTCFPPIAVLAPLKLGRLFVEDRFSTRGEQVLWGSRGR